MRVMDPMRQRAPTAHAAVRLDGDAVVDPGAGADGDGSARVADDLGRDHPAEEEDAVADLDVALRVEPERAADVDAAAAARAAQHDAPARDAGREIDGAEHLRAPQREPLERAFEVAHQVGEARHRHLRWTVAGSPATTARSGIRRVTTVPAPTAAPRPTCAPGSKMDADAERRVVLDDHGLRGRPRVAGANPVEVVVEESCRSGRW